MPGRVILGAAPSQPVCHYRKTPCPATTPPGLPDQAAGAPAGANWPPVQRTRTVQDVALLPVAGKSFDSLVTLIPGRQRAQRYPVLDEDIVRLSPFVREHLNVVGKYTFVLRDLGEGGIRPLRDPDATDDEMPD
jgi:hypothetical protein